jgi:hypothetical protein
VDHLNWVWIGVMVVVPPVISIPVAAYLWRKGEVALGNVAGMAVIFIVALGLIFMEYAELARLTQLCQSQGQVCWATPSGFIRYAIYAGIGLFEVFALFAVSLKMEERDRNSSYAPEWRR